MFVVRVSDDAGEPVRDLDVYLTGPHKDRGCRPDNALVDCIRNPNVKNTFAFCLNYDLLVGAVVRKNDARCSRGVMRPRGPDDI